MAKLIEGIPRRKFDPEFDIDEDNACILSDDDMDDIDLYEDMDSYSYTVDETKRLVTVKAKLNDGNVVTVSMTKQELATYIKGVNYARGIDDEEEEEEEKEEEAPSLGTVLKELSEMTPEQKEEMIAVMKAKQTPAQKAAGVFAKIIFGICAVIAIILILVKIFG